MRAIVITRFGDPEVLEMRDVPEPQPGPGQIAIRVGYAGVNYLEIMARRRGYRVDQLPFVPGLEVSGTIHTLGEGVEGLQIGQPVAALTMKGGYAEIALAQAILTFPLDGLSRPIELATAAGFPAAVPTAYDLLVHLARLQHRESVLVHAAAGGVGIMAGQLARHLGAELIMGTVSSREKAIYAQSFGYDQIFLRDTFVQSVLEATHGHGVNVVLDAAGEPTRSQSLSILAPFGRLVVYGNASGGQDIPFTPGTLLARNTAIMGYSLSALSNSAPDLLATTAHQALDLVATSHLHIDITDVLPLNQAIEAHRHVEEGSTMGKLLLSVTV